MAIELRSIPNDDLISRAEEIAGLQVNTDFADIRGRMVSGKFISAKALDRGLIGVKLERWLDGRHVMDSHRPGRTGPAGPPLAHHGPRPRRSPAAGRGSLAADSEGPDGTISAPRPALLPWLTSCPWLRTSRPSSR
ncbi:hypothetical protein [Arthrobacter mobilis]|uniref:Uncharacterized protein n=1 Tax=Arthrobacter mobilis TaxID=2724944 RepID=A0A7X6K6Z1_9MICC|nr:hypothetical protein [Arthrobacter mobilis]NKX55988.1 hypothetical protein [Arthrobacter mobilis]